MGGLWGYMGADVGGWAVKVGAKKGGGEELQVSA